MHPPHDVAHEPAHKPSRGALTLMRATWWLFLGFGLASAAASHPATQAPWALLFDILQWPIDGKPQLSGPNERVLSAVLGGVLVGWSTLMLWMLKGPVAQGDPSAVRAYSVAVLAWFVVDTTASLLAGWPGNALLNVASLLMGWGPLLLRQRMGLGDKAA
jgi:hypothetical protein